MSEPIGLVAAASITVDPDERRRELAEIKAAERSKTPSAALSCGACGWSGSPETYRQHRDECPGEET